MSPILSTLDPRALVVDIRAVLSLVGRITRWLSLTLVVPAGVALLYGESMAPFIGTLVIGVIGGTLLEVACGRRSEDVRVREAFAVVALMWLVAALLGSIPYMLAGGDIASPIDAYFETMSGFTTTGSSVMADIESHPASILFWRSMTQWLGGMGIIVLALAVLGSAGPAGKALMEREAPGPEVEKLTPRLRDTALRLWLVYVGLTGALVLALWVVGLIDMRQGMNLYDAVTHAFTAMSTGGFSPNARSVEPYGWIALAILTIFMIIAGANFALWYLVARGSWRAPLRDGEFRLYLAILAIASALVAVVLDVTTDKGFIGSIGESIFQVVTVMTTTGYASQDFAVWAGFALLILFLLMFIGGCAGSTSGAIKVIRLRLIAGGMARDVRTSVHPEAVLPIRSNGRPVREAAVQGAAAVGGLYVATWVIGTIVILMTSALQGYDLPVFDGMAAAATAIGNVGPGFGVAGPMGSFATYPDVAKIAMILLMWIGRLEIIPVLVLLTRSYWRR